MLHIQEHGPDLDFMAWIEKLSLRDPRERSLQPYLPL